MIFSLVVDVLVFSAHAEVVLFMRIFLTVIWSILRARGGSSQR